MYILQNFKLYKLKKYHSAFNDMKSNDNEKYLKTQPSLNFFKEI